MKVTYTGTVRAVNEQKDGYQIKIEPDSRTRISYGLGYHNYPVIFIEKDKLDGHAVSALSNVHNLLDLSFQICIKQKFGI